MRKLFLCLSFVALVAGALLVPPGAAAQVVSAPPDVVAHVIERINYYRRSNGCAALVADERLMRTAQAHAQEMAERDYFGHVSADGKTVLQRFTDAGYRFLWAGENIMSWEASPEAVVDGWYGESPPADPHRRNIVKCDFQHIGVGYYALENDTGKVRSRRYWVADFGQPAPGSALSSAGSPTNSPPGSVSKRPLLSTCTARPGTPTLLSPGSGAPAGSSVLLDWSDVQCTRKYRVIVRRDAHDGARVARKRLAPSQFDLSALAGGVTYYWRARACNPLGCSAWTVYRSFFTPL